ncbi:hypothetical protein AAFC00_004486 [Neodothiora populina]|uniref:HhH-GPD domain-containing protein n=1 Tax=Neodothiora populina TaxID=2781224 RepID=A0ABR3P2G8_9PEZI
MSLRRSARVQAIEPMSKVVNPNSLKRAFATTKAGTRSKSTKDTTKPDHVEKENSIPTVVPSTKRDTPAKRRRVASSPPNIAPVIASPTPLHSTGDVDDAIPSSNGVRPVDPHITNAPISSPQDGHVTTAYSNHENGVPINGPVPPPTGTTSTLLDQAIAHLLKTDTTGRLAPVIAAHHCAVFSPAGLAEIIDPFRSLASGIMAQQVSGAAASSIKNKFIGLFPATATHLGPPHFPFPELVAQTPLTTLRTAGLSQRKAEYIQGLASHFVSGELSAEMLARASDDEVMERLVAVRGLGKWSVEMFACFSLKRADVFSTGDLGVQRGMAAWQGRDVAKLKSRGSGGKWKYMSEKDMLELSAPFSPYRSLFMWYMWRVEDVDVGAIQNA